MASRDGFKMLVERRREISADGFGILHHLFGSLEPGDPVRVNQTELAKALNTHQQQISLAVRRLVTVGALVEGDRAGRYRFYSLNPEFTWTEQRRQPNGDARPDPETVELPHNPPVVADAGQVEVEPEAVEPASVEPPRRILASLFADGRRNEVDPEQAAT